MTIRPATPQDAEAIAALHVQAWRESYPGLVPEAVLAALDPARRAEVWRAVIPRGGVFLGCDRSEPVGFVAWGPQGDAVLPFGAEITALYVLRRAQWRGLGRRLMAAAMADMRGAGFELHGAVGARRQRPGAAVLRNPGRAALRHAAGPARGLDLAGDRLWLGPA